MHDVVTWVLGVIGFVLIVFGMSWPVYVFVDLRKRKSD